jgi:serine/threonine-protein kinase
MTRCPSSEQLQQLLAELLTGPEAEAVEAHVETCAACQHALVRLTGGRDADLLAAPFHLQDATEGSGANFLRRLEKVIPADVRGCRANESRVSRLKEPNPISKPFSPGEPTGPYPSTVGVDQPVKVALVPGAGRPRPEEDVGTLLRRRLLFLAVLFSAGMVAWLVLALLYAVTYRGQLTLDAWLSLGVAFFMFTLGSVLAAVLWRRSLSLGQLRTLELVLFGAIYVLWVGLHTYLYPRLRLQRPPPIWFGAIMAHSVSIPWSFMIISYGILIPNTWRRCAAVVGVMVITPFVISTATGFAAAATEGGSQADFFITLAVWITTAAAIAVFGAHRIEVLRREVLAVRRLGQYQLKQPLGSGGMGEVYLAEHVLLKRPCAIKLIRPERAGDPSHLARFEREVQATATLTHPNTVEIFDYGHAEDGTFYYVMEYLAGLSLEELVKRHGPLPPARVVHLLRQVCGALREAHATGLVHRDIKPGNILLCQRGGLCDVAKLLDFGLVRAHGLNPDGQQLTQEGTIAGTPAYMSPEQAAGRTDLDGHSDLYSLGAVAYFLLTGQPPFVRATVVQTLAAHLGDPVVPPDRHRPDLPADLQAVLLHCLEKEPVQRFQDAESLEQALGLCGCAGQWTREQAAAWWRDCAEKRNETQ